MDYGDSYTESLTPVLLDTWTFSMQAKNKNKIKTYGAESDVSVIYMKKTYYDCNYIPLVWIITYYESKIEKQDLQAGER